VLVLWPVHHKEGHDSVCRLDGLPADSGQSGGSRDESPSALSLNADDDLQRVGRCRPVREPSCSNSISWHLSERLAMQRVGEAGARVLGIDSGVRAKATRTRHSQAAMALEKSEKP
jgi:hypothetical protein